VELTQLRLVDLTAGEVEAGEIAIVWKAGGFELIGRRSHLPVGPSPPSGAAIGWAAPPQRPESLARSTRSRRALRPRKRGRRGPERCGGLSSRASAETAAARSSVKIETGISSRQTPVRETSACRCPSATTISPCCTRWPRRSTPTAAWNLWELWRENSRLQVRLRSGRARCIGPRALSCEAFGLRRLTLGRDVSGLEALATLRAYAAARAKDAQRTGGEGGIRTHGRLAPTEVFKTSALSHSATSPNKSETKVGTRLARGVFSELFR
jgi:hypothetical protein